MNSPATAMAMQHDFGEQIEVRLQEIERLADDDEWEKIEIILHRLPGLITRIPASERGDILLGIQVRIEKFHDRALLHRGELADKLGLIRTGRRASASYQATEALAGTA